MKMNSLDEKALQAILYGHSCTMQLKERLDNPMVDQSVSNYDLAKTIVRCFSNAISILSVEPQSEDDHSSRNSSPPQPQRSHSKKRKVNNTHVSESWTHESPNPTYYDQFLWRKYGEKYIKKSGHQRSYYRCSYNKDDLCRARKHEEKIKDNPPVYRTTYFGHHTCKTNHNKDAMFSAGLDMKSAQMIRFGKDTIKKESIGQFLDISGGDQDCQHVMEENESSSSGSYSPPPPP